MEHLSEAFWTNRYRSSQTGWDLGAVSPPLKEYIDQLKDKSIAILIPGCGNGYEAEYLHDQGFTDVHVIDLSSEPLNALKTRIPDFPEAHVHQGDFFTHKGTYDLILEQTMFCAIDPKLRAEYARKSAELLKPGGKLVGLLFNVDFDGGPPYGGGREEYLTYFEPYFGKITMDPCHNSIPPRQNRELFIRLTKD